MLIAGRGPAAPAAARRPAATGGGAAWWPAASRWCSWRASPPRLAPCAPASASSPGTMSLCSRFVHLCILSVAIACSPDCTMMKISAARSAERYPLSAALVLMLTH